MNKTKIEWVKNPDGTPGYTWNPITGCLNGCPYCYARRLANGRLKQRYLANHKWTTCEVPHSIPALLDPFFPRFWEGRLEDIKREPLPWFHRGKDLRKGIFVCDMGELFGDWVPKEWQEEVFRVIKRNSQHRFYLLTKQPQNLIKWSPFPENCWVGVTATGYKVFNQALDYLKGIEARIKYISMEPLLEAIPFYMDRLAYCGINWLIIGAMTGNLEDIKKMLMEYPQLALKTYDYKRWTLQPRLEWVEAIIEAADKAGIPVFLKNNLFPLLEPAIRNSHHQDVLELGGEVPLRQEMPK